MASPGNNQSSNEESFLHALQLSGIIVLPMVLKVAVELDLFEIIGKAGPGAQISPTDVASQLPTQNPDAPGMLDRILRLLASYSILTSSITTREDGLVERLYGLKSVGKYFVRDEDGVSLSPATLLITDKVFMDSWSHMKDAILEGGIPFNKAHGMHAFQYPETDPRFNQLFNSAMFSLTAILMKKILATYKGFDGLKQVVDVGGGVGITIGLITSKYPTIKGVNFDLPHVIDHAPPYPGVEHIGGDMFDSVPTTEAIFMKWILHDWSDKDCITLLKNCLNALPDHGKVIVVEAILPILPETSTFAKGLCQGDLIMLSQNPGGKERTEEEYITLGKEAGFARMEKVCCIYDFWVMEFYKT